MKKIIIVIGILISPFLFIQMLKFWQMQFISMFHMSNFDSGYVAFMVVLFTIAGVAMYLNHDKF